jgi:hypothetical protein
MQDPICDEAAADKQLTKTIARYGRVDLLCIDLCRPRNYADNAARYSPATSPAAATPCSTAFH